MSSRTISRIIVGVTVGALLAATGVSSASASPSGSQSPTSRSVAVATTLTSPVGGTTAAGRVGAEEVPVTYGRDGLTQSGPAPDWFRDPNFQPAGSMPEVPSTSLAPDEVFLEMPYCRDVYANYYWMSASDNPASCTRGYVKYYDSRNSSYLGSIDVYVLYDNLTIATGIVTAIDWCTSNFICGTLAAWLISSKISAAWTLIRAIKWGL